MKKLKVHIQIYYYHFPLCKAFVTQKLFDEYKTIEISDEELASWQKQKGNCQQEQLAHLADPYIDYLREKFGDTDVALEAYVTPVFDETDASTEPKKGSYWVEDGILYHCSEKAEDGGLISLVSCLDKTKTSVTSSIAQVVEAGAFRDCRYLREINLPHAAVIRESAFEGCTSLLSVNLSDELSFIQERSFAGCVMLREFRIPQGVQGIFSEAFLNCFNLTRLILPDGAVITPDNAPSEDDLMFYRHLHLPLSPNITTDEDSFAFTPIDYLSDNPCYEDDDDE